MLIFRTVLLLAGTHFFEKATTFNGRRRDDAASETYTTDKRMRSEMGINVV